MEPEVALVIAGVEYDVLGIGVPERFIPGFERENFADVIEGSDWPD